MLTSKLLHDYFIREMCIGTHNSKNKIHIIIVKPIDSSFQSKSKNNRKSIYLIFYTLIVYKYIIYLHIHLYYAMYHFIVIVSKPNILKM